MEQPSDAVAGDGDHQPVPSSIETEIPLNNCQNPVLDINISPKETKSMLDDRINRITTSPVPETINLDTVLQEPKFEGVLISDIESKHLENQANLKSRLEEFQLRCQELEKAVTDRDETITNLQRSCIILEKESALHKRELDISIKEKESTIIRYATVEKKVIDANSARETAEKKWKDGQREVEALNIKIKSLNSENGRISQTVNQKVGILV